MIVDINFMTSETLQKAGDILTYVTNYKSNF